MTLQFGIASGKPVTSTTATSILILYFEFLVESALPSFLNIVAGYFFDQHKLIRRIFKSRSGS
jgi:hypothetical protein